MGPVIIKEKKKSKKSKTGDMVKVKLFVTYDEMVCTMMGRKKENGTFPWIQKEETEREKRRRRAKKIYDGSPERSKRYRYLHLRPTSIVRGSTSGYCII
jgi:hypothetical protein